jgi:hypothetical protein
LGPLATPAWQDLLRAAVAERLTGLLAAVVRDGTIRATATQADEATAAHRHATYLNLALEGVLVDAVACLTSAGLDHRVLKGPAVARLDHPDIALRCFTDVDLLVRATELDAAVAALIDAGLTRADPQVREGFDRRFGKGATLLTRQGLAVDVHRTLDRGPFGVLVDLDDLWRDPVVIEVAGAEMRALPAEQRLLSLCFHAALGDVPPRLGPLRDVALIVLGGQADDGRALELAHRWRADAVVARAVTLAWAALDLREEAPLLSWARAREPSPWDRRMLALYLDPGESHLARALAMLRVIRPVRAKVAYARAITFPSSDYLADRQRRHLDHWGLVRLPWRGGRRTGEEP